MRLTYSAEYIFPHLRVVVEPRLEEDEVFVSTLVNFAAAHPGKTLVLQSCSDGYTILLARNRAALEPYFAFACPTEENVMNLDMMFKGTITVESTYGKGSTFTVNLIQDIKNDVKIIEEQQQIKEETYDNIKVLVVDDSNLNLKVADNILKKYNIKTELITNGEDCINKIKNGETYNIIFMDIMMPNMSGEETLMKLKEIPNFNIPVVALTADAMEGKKEKYLSEGFTEYLSKPIQKIELEELLSKILNNQK